MGLTVGLGVTDAEPVSGAASAMEWTLALVSAWGCQKDNFIDVHHDMHIGKAQVAGRGWIG